MVRPLGSQSIALVLVLACGAVSIPAAAAPAPTQRSVATSRPNQPGPVRRAYLRELASWRSVVRKPVRLTRLVLTSGLSLAAGSLTGFLTASPGAAAFVSFSTGVLVNRLADRLMPSSRMLGAPRPPPWLRDGAQSLVGATVAATATPLLMRALSPLIQAGPGAFGLGTQLLLSRPLVKGLGSLTASLLAHGARAGLATLFRIRSAR